MPETLGLQLVSEVNPEPEMIPEGEYVYTFLAEPKRMALARKRAIDCNATIFSQGDFTGRKVFFRYPNPDLKDWSSKVMKRLTGALGVEVEDGTNPIDSLNAAAGTHFRGRYSAF